MRKKKKKRYNVTRILMLVLFGVVVTLALLVVLLVLWQPSGEHSHYIMRYLGPVVLVENEAATLYDAPRTDANPVFEIEHDREYQIDGTACGWYLITYRYNPDELRQAWVNGADVRAIYSDFSRDSVEEIAYDCD